jgi:integrase
MLIPTNYIPQPTRHASGQAVVRLNGRDHYLGRWGTAGAKLAYERLVAEWLAHGRNLPSANGLTVNELIAAFWAWAQKHYRRPDGTPTNEVTDYKLSLRPLKHLYGGTLANDFGPLAMQAVRELMVQGYTHPKHGPQPALARGVVNQRIGRVRRMFKWATANELTPAKVYHGLLAVTGLQRGRSDARETDAVKPVPIPFVDAILPYLRPQVAAMVRLQLETGMRPGEVVIMRGIDLDTSGTVWLYRPSAHKTDYRGHHRVVTIGPKGQAILRPWLRLNVEEFLFSPREAVEDQHAERRQNRRSQITPSQAVRRRKHKPSRNPADRYSTQSYGRPVTRGIDLANRVRACDACKTKAPADWCDDCRSHTVPHWHPHQLRHTKATEIRRVAGLDAARAVLGHRSPVVTEVYAELDLAKAAEVMAKIG